MKRIHLFCLSGLIFFTACNGVGSSTSSVDYKMLTQPDDLKKKYNEALDMLGSHKAATDEVTFNISRPSSEGMVQMKGKPDWMMMTASYQSPDNKNRIYEQSYTSEYGWKGEEKEIQVMGAHPEDYKLQDDLFDITPVTADALNKVVADAKAKYTDAAKYKDQYVKSININRAGIQTEIHGRLAANDQEKSEFYRTDLTGNPKGD